MRYREAAYKYRNTLERAYGTLTEYYGQRPKCGGDTIMERMLYEMQQVLLLEKDKYE